MGFLFGDDTCRWTWNVDRGLIEGLFLNCGLCLYPMLLFAFAIRKTCRVNLKPLCGHVECLHHLF